MQLNWRRLRDDGGATLTEVLVTVVILSVIILPLGNALIGLIRLTDGTSRRLDESHDIQLLTSYFTNDVQSVGARDWTAYPYPLTQSVELAAPPTGGRYPCGTAATPAAVLRLAWDDPTGGGPVPQVVRVAYVVQTVAGARQLHRLTCVGSATPTSDLVVVHNLGAGTPTVVCSSACTAAPAVPHTITMTVPIQHPDSPGLAEQVTVTGQRRQT